jgi:hypothetical protein
MSQMDRATQFVNQQVEHFIKKHQAKLMEVYPAPSEKEIIASSGNKALIAAVEDTLALEKTIIRMIDELEEVSAKYSLKFGSTVEDLVEKAMAERSALLTAKQKDFEFRIREAIGLVELVSSEDAFNVLNGCRNEIEQMGKE